MKKSYLTLLVFVWLTAAASTTADETTLVVTLKGLPPPSIHPLQPPPVQASPYSQAAPTDTLSPPPPAHAPVPHPNVVGRLGVCVWHGAPIYGGRLDGGRMLARVAQGTYLAIKSDYAEWYAVLMIDGSLGWIQKSAVRLLEYNVVRSPSPAPDSAASRGSGLGSEVLKEAFKYLGVPYVWGGNGGSGLDCSGLVKNCFAHCGVSLPRRASEQARVGQPVPLRLAELQPGDRLYFAVGRPSIDHTGIYLGNGYFIHASMSRRKVGIDHLSKPLYGRHLVAARRS